MPKLYLSFSAYFLQQTSDLKLSGNLDLSVFSQTSAGELRSYFSWKFRKYSAMAKLDIVFSGDFSQETPDLKLSGKLESSLSQISPGNLRFYAFWKIDQSFFRKFLQVTFHFICFQENYCLFLGKT